MLAPKALSIALRRRGLAAGSPPPVRAATEISRMILVKILPRFASCAFLRCWMFAHLEWPAMETPWNLRERTAIIGAGGRAGPGGLHVPDRALPRPPRPGPGRSVPRRSSAGEPPRAEEGGDLPHGLWREQQAAVRGIDHHVVGEPGRPGFLQPHG